MVKSGPSLFIIITLGTYIKTSITNFEVQAKKNKEFDLEHMNSLNKYSDNAFIVFSNC